MKLNMLVLFAAAGLISAAEAPAAKSVAIPEVEALKVQVQDRDLGLLDARYQVLQLQIGAARAESDRLQAAYKLLQVQRNQAIETIYQNAKVSKDAFDLDIDGHKLVEHPKTAASK